MFKRLTTAGLAGLLLMAAGTTNAWWGGGWNPYDPWDPRYWMEEFFGDSWSGGPWGYGGGPWGYGGGPWGYGGGPWGYGGGPWGGYHGAPYYGYTPWGYGVPYHGYAHTPTTTATNTSNNK